MKARRSGILVAVLGLWLLLPEAALADNCGSLSDCYNTLRAALAAAVAAGLFGALFSLGLDLLPGVGTVKGILEAFTGRDLVTGQELAWWERALGVIPFLGAVGDVGRRLGDLAGAGADLARGADRLADAAGAGADLARGADRAADAAGAGADAARAADRVADVSELVSRHGDEARRIVAEYGDDLGGDILRTYDEIADIDGAQNLLKDVVAGGSTAQGALSEIGYAASLKKQGVQIEKVGDVIGGKKAGDILVKNGPVIDVKDYNWNSPFYRNPNNVEKARDSILQQVQRHRDRYPGRPVEYAFTDLAGAPQGIIDALVEAGVQVRQVTWIGR